MDNAPDKISLYVSNKIANMSLFCALLVVLIHVDAPSRSSQAWWIVHYVLRFILATIAVAMTMWAVAALRRFFPRFASLLFGGR